MVVHALYPYDPRVAREARAAREAGYGVEVVCLQDAGEPAQEMLDGIGVRRLPIAHRRGVGAARMALEYLRFALQASWAVLRAHRRERIDIVHVHAPPDFLVLAGVLPRLTGARVALDIHDLSPHMFEARFPSGIARALGTRGLIDVQRLSCRLADRVITVHEPYRRELAASGVPAEKIEVIMNSPDTSVIQRVLDQKNAAPRTKGEFVVGYHGTITEWYGVDLLLDAIARLRVEVPGLKGVVLGAGDALPKVRALAKDLRIADRITLPGHYLPMERALAIIANCNCGVIPNRPTSLNRFALSSKLFEYVALGVPVVVSRLDTLAAHFDETEVAFFEPGNATSLARAIAFVYREPEEAAFRVERARARLKSYGWEINRRRYWQVLDALAHPAV